MAFSAGYRRCRYINKVNVAKEAVKYLLPGSLEYFFTFLQEKEPVHDIDELLALCRDAETYRQLLDFHLRFDPRDETTWSEGFKEYYKRLNDPLEWLAEQKKNRGNYGQNSPGENERDINGSGYNEEVEERPCFPEGELGEEL